MGPSEVIFTVEESLEGGYEARALGYPIYTQADTVDALRSALVDAVRCHFGPGDTPRKIRFHFVADPVLVDL